MVHFPQNFIYWTHHNWKKNMLAWGHSLPPTLCIAGKVINSPWTLQHDLSICNSWWQFSAWLEEQCLKGNFRGSLGQTPLLVTSALLPIKMMYCVAANYSANNSQRSPCYGVWNRTTPFPECQDFYRGEMTYHQFTQWEMPLSSDILGTPGKSKIKPSVQLLQNLVEYIYSHTYIFE